MAVIQIDPASAIAYDSLRFWRLVMEKRELLGDAGRCLFIMSVLPIGNGFNVSSPLFNSVGMAKLFVYVARLILGILWIDM